MGSLAGTTAFAGYRVRRVELVGVSSATVCVSGRPVITTMQ